ncbi:hypothetical protein FDUTEX481_06556 [Tolypothrix sp. PCC 7601]|nr:hypothetical protein FDUTEX481_06556 [Tolypothrix sp. PCC 7601]
MEVQSAPIGFAHLAPGLTIYTIFYTPVDNQQDGEETSTCDLESAVQSWDSASCT